MSASRPVLSGIHHVTAITADPQSNIDFYCGLLGLRLVKLTVNFDDPTSYHLYYGDRLGRRRVLLGCLTVGALVYFPQMLTTHPTQLLVLRTILGFAMGGVTPTANSLIAEGTPEGRQGGVYGISASFNAAGRALGPVLGAVVVTHWGTARVFPVTGTLLSLVVFIVFLGTRSLRPAQAGRPSTPAEPAFGPLPSGLPLPKATFAPERPGGRPPPAFLSAPAWPERSPGRSGRHPAIHLHTPATGNSSDDTRDPADRLPLSVVLLS